MTERTGHDEPGDTPVDESVDELVDESAKAKSQGHGSLDRRSFLRRAAVTGAAGALLGRHVARNSDNRYRCR